MATLKTIGRAARRARVGVETIRFYERRGLIAQPPKPRTGGYREYDDETVAAILFIRQAQELGFSLREIGELLSLRTDPKANCGDVRAQALIKREEVDRKIGQLAQIRNALDALIASCPGSGALRVCTIIDGLTTLQPEPAGQKHLDPRGPTNDDSVEPAKGGGMRTVTLQIEGMHCASCARTVEMFLSAEPGVKKAAASKERHEVRVLFDPQIVDDERLAGVIRNAGYRVSQVTS